MARHGAQLGWIAERLRDRGVIELLERLATGLWVRRDLGETAGIQARSEALNALKPDVSNDAATKAVEEIDTTIVASAHALTA